MSWNYRLVRHLIKNRNKNYEWYGIHEVYYKESGKIRMISQDAMEPFGENPKEIKENLKMMMRAFKKPIVDYGKLKEIKIKK